MVGTWPVPSEPRTSRDEALAGVPGDPQPRRRSRPRTRTEAHGFHGMWLGSAFGFDPVMALALAGAATSRVALGVAVIPSWPRHPVVAAQQAATANAACGGRFRLGLGPSHVPVMGMYGIDARPACAAQPRVPRRGPLAAARPGASIIGATGSGCRRSSTSRGRHRIGHHCPVLLGVLREQMARVAGGHADGALCWLAPARTSSVWSRPRWHVAPPTPVAA